MPKAKILIVDDDTDFVFYTKTVLEQNGYEVDIGRHRQPGHDHACPGKAPTGDSGRHHVKRPGRSHHEPASWPKTLRSKISPSSW